MGLFIPRFMRLFISLLTYGEAESYSGEKYTRFKPCPCCDGSGKRTKWVDMKTFAELLEKATAFEPDTRELSQHKPITQYQDSCDAAGIP